MKAGHSDGRQALNKKVTDELSVGVTVLQRPITTVSDQPEAALGRLSVAQADLVACDQLIRRFDARLNPSYIAPIRGWKGHYGKRGDFLQAIQRILQEAVPHPVSTPILALTAHIAALSSQIQELQAKATQLATALDALALLSEARTVLIASTWRVEKRPQPVSWTQSSQRNVNALPRFKPPSAAWGKSLGKPSPPWWKPATRKICTAVKGSARARATLSRGGTQAEESAGPSKRAGCDGC